MTNDPTIEPISPQVIPEDSRSVPPASAEAVVIGQKKSWFGTSLRELWKYRELLYFLAWRDVKVRYKQTALGLAWVILQPVLSTIVFTIFLGKVLNVPSNNIPYVLFAFVGIMIWTFFATTTTTLGHSLVSNAHLITKVFFPRLVIPISGVVGRLVDFAVALVILVVPLAYYRVVPGRSILALPFLILLLVLFTLALGIWIAALNVRYRDVGLALPVLIQLGMFATPVVYPMSMVPAKWHFVYSLNPMVGIVENVRAALFNQPFNLRALLISVVVTVILLPYATYVFRRQEQVFADIV